MPLLTRCSTRFDVTLLGQTNALVNKNWTRKYNNWTIKMISGTGLTKACASGPPPLDRT